MKKIYWIAALMALFAFVACEKEEKEKEEEDDNPVIPSTGVRFDLDEVPYDKLSDYRFYIGTLNELHPNERVLPYDVITPLFADYAKKKKFIWMPEGSVASYASDSEILDFPEGAVMIKNFYYDRVQPNDERRLLETRLLYLKDGEWIFADYLWNDDQTEAYLDLDGADVPITWIDDNDISRSTTFRIPSESECFTCHKVNNIAMPIGPKPQNLNRDYNYETGSMNQLQKWIEVGYLENSLPENIETVAKWDDETLPLHDRVRAYVDMNCAHCHRQDSHCSYREMRFAWSETTEDYNLGICMEPAEILDDALTYVVAPGNINRSVLHYRINTTHPAQRMPLLGRTLVHEEAVDLVEEWINSITTPCQ